MAAVADKAAKRRELILTIVKYARQRNLDASFALVNRNLPVWEQWYLGRFATGHLMRRTGVKKIKEGYTSADSNQ